jgi:ABC-type iron transport system FetAB permease component
MRRMKSTTRRQQTIAVSSSSSEEELSLGADHVEASAPTCDAASSSAVSQRRGGVPSQRG